MPSVPKRPVSPLRAAVRHACAWLALALGAVLTVTAGGPRWAAWGGGAVAVAVAEFAPPAEHDEADRVASAQDGRDLGADDDAALDGGEEDGDEAAVRVAAAAPEAEGDGPWPDPARPAARGDGLPRSSGHVSEDERPPRSA